MNHTVPPAFDLEETSFVSFVGVGARELIIVGGGLLLGVLLGTVLPWGWPVKIGSGTLLAAFGIWLAIGREPGSAEEPPGWSGSRLEGDAKPEERSPLTGR